MEYPEIQKAIKENEKKLDAFRGCLIGGAAGDALGYPVEFMTYDAICKQYGRGGIQKYTLTGDKALISDDTQMTLFTATGLLWCWTRSMCHGIAPSLDHAVGLAYRCWYARQTETRLKSLNVSWLYDVPEMGEYRAPGNTCMSAIGAAGPKCELYGTIEKPVNTSKGCGGVMRVAPVGLYLNREPSKQDDIVQVDDTAARVAALTHGHELGWLPAAALAHIINRIAHGGLSLRAAVTDSIEFLETKYADRTHLGELTAIMRKAAELADNRAADIDNIAVLGGGWVAEETLAIALYCALKYETDFSKALCVSVNHSGDSDSTGAVTGNILGALWGYERIPEIWKKNLECHDVILEVADDLCRDCHMTEYGSYRDEDWIRKYIDCKWKSV